MFKAHGLWYHSTLGSRVINKPKLEPATRIPCPDSRNPKSTGNVVTARVSWPTVSHRGEAKREFCIGNLLVRIHLIIGMIWWTDLAPWEFEFPLEQHIIEHLALHLRP